jgi:glycerol-3-phosphate dehydrogenase
VSGASLTRARRARELEALAGGERVDVVVVGGGITGAGIALDAASRGLSVALLERADLAHGTSRWSSKLVHGGLRYLEHREWGLAWESARERARLMEHIAPHLVRPLPFVIPLAAAIRRRDAARTMAGLRIGDGLRAGARTRRSVLPPARRISALEARRLAPALDEDGLRGALLSWDGQLEDDARLVVAVARTAAAHGARVLTRVRVTGVDAAGVDAVDEAPGGGGRLRVSAGRVVLATGVWTGELAPAARLRPSRGSHLLVPAERLGAPRAAVNLPVPGERGRWVFALPRTDGLVAIGLTDVPADEPVDEPRPSAAEEDELLARASAALAVRLVPADVVGRYAGLRPLLAGEPAATADLSRRHAVVEDPESGALAVVGGKLTTYRAMAQDAVDRLTDRPCRTARLPLVGAAPPAALRAVGAPEPLVRRYGTEAPAVVALADGRPELLQPVAPGVPWCGAELLWALRHELVLAGEDLVDRRTRAGLVPEWGEAVRAAAQALDEPVAA